MEESLSTSQPLIDVVVDLTNSQSSQPPVSSYSLRHSFFLRLIRSDSIFKNSLLRTSVILNADDAEILRKDFSLLLRDICNVLSERTDTLEENRFLSKCLVSNFEKVSDDFEEPITFIGSIAHLECSFRLDLVPKLHCMTFDDIGQSLEVANETVKNVISGVGKRERDELKKGWTWGSTLKNVSLLIRAKHLESQKQRTLKLITDDPSKIAHYFTKPVDKKATIDDDIEKFLGQRPSGVSVQHKSKKQSGGGGKGKSKS
jgi:hypothetical protein